MINKRQIFILLLALWLPSQALANALLHCEWIDEVSAISHAAHLHEAAKPDCHGDTTVLPEPLDETPRSLHTQTESTAEHCNGNCHGVQPVSIVPCAEPQTTPINAFVALPSAAEISSIPENPQRPPKPSINPA